MRVHPTCHGIQQDTSDIRFKAQIVTIEILKYWTWRGCALLKR